MFAPKSMHGISTSVPSMKIHPITSLFTACNASKSIAGGILSVSLQSRRAIPVSDMLFFGIFVDRFRLPPIQNSQGFDTRKETPRAEAKTTIHSRCPFARRLFLISIDKLQINPLLAVVREFCRPLAFQTAMRTTYRPKPVDCDSFISNSKQPRPWPVSIPDVLPSPLPLFFLILFANSFQNRAMLLLRLPLNRLARKNRFCASCQYSPCRSAKTCAKKRLFADA